MLQRITSTINIKKDGLIKYVPASGTNPTTGSWNIIDLDTQPLTQFSGNLPISRIDGNLPANRLENIDMSKVATGNLPWSRIASKPLLTDLGGTLSYNNLSDKPDSQILSLDVPLTNEPTITSSAFTETIRTFTHSGGTEEQTPHTITIGQNTICDILIVGGGGGGGVGGDNGRGGGGGGAGQFLLKTNYLFNAGTYNIKIGKGGLGGNTTTQFGETGKNSTITTLSNTLLFEAIGGGGGARGVLGNVSDGLNGASGGGGCGNFDANTGLGGTATIQFVNNDIVYTGYNGASGGPAFNGGGGGGYTSAGNSATTTNGGDGGSGITNNITGVVMNYCAGGGGGAYNGGISTGRRGGNGGNITAGNGGKWPGAKGGDATSGSGSGGGGGGPSNAGGGTFLGGNGGSGIIIIKFRTIVNTGIPEGNPITHKTLNFAYSPIYPFIQADNTNLKAWYKFDGNYMDSSQSGYNLTNSGTVIVNGLIVQSVSADASDFLETSGINLNGKTYSISFWAKFNTIPASDVFFWTQSSANAVGSTVILQYQQGNNVLRFSHYGSGNDMDTTGYNVSSMVGTSWHHYVVTYNSTNRGAEIWFDGVKLNTNISTLTNAFTGGGNFTIGKWVTNPNPNIFNGLMEDFRYYDKILTSIEISQLYSIPTQNTYTLSVQAGTSIQVNNGTAQYLSGNYTISVGATQSSVLGLSGQTSPYPLTNGSNIAIRYSMLQRITATDIITQNILNSCNYLKSVDAPRNIWKNIISTQKNTIYYGAPVKIGGNNAIDVGNNYILEVLGNVRIKGTITQGWIGDGSTSGDGGILQSGQSGQSGTVYTGDSTITGNFVVNNNSGAFFNINSAERFKITDAGVYFQNNTWHYCLTGNQRFNFAPSGTTYIRGHGSTPSSIPIEFRNASDVAIVTFTNAGDLRAIGDISAYYSDERLKTITEYVSDVLPILSKINVFKYNCNDLAASYGYDKNKKEIGLSAQEIQKYYPELVCLAPFDSIYDSETQQTISKSGEDYLTLNYERLVPVLLQAIKELNNKYEALEEKYSKLYSNPTAI